MSKSFIRIIKNENKYLINKGGNDNKCTEVPNCIIKYHLINNKFTKMKYNCNNNNTSVNLLNSSDILDMYNIYTAEDLSKYIDNNYSHDFEKKILRIVNCWIRHNYNSVKNNFFIENILMKVTGIDDNKIIKEFISYWVDKNKESNFNLDIIKDINLYLEKKSNIN